MFVEKLIVNMTCIYQASEYAIFNSQLPWRHKRDVYAGKLLILCGVLRLCGRLRLPVLYFYSCPVCGLPAAL